MVHEGVEGTLFAVWAPEAKRVSVIGEFNGWKQGIPSTERTLGRLRHLGRVHPGHRSRGVL